MNLLPNQKPINRINFSRINMMLTTKKLAKLFLIAICAINLSACMGNVTGLPKYDAKSPDSQNRAVVIVNPTNASGVSIIRFDNNYNDPKTRKEYVFGGKDMALFFGSYRQVVFSVEPGVYYISNARYTDGVYDYFTTAPGLTPEGYVVYGAFEVKPGDVIYVGDIWFNWRKKKDYEFLVLGKHLDKVKEDLLAKDEYKALVPKLKETKFYYSGSKIYVDDHGVARLSK